MKENIQENEIFTLEWLLKCYVNQPNTSYDHVKKTLPAASKTR